MNRFTHVPLLLLKVTAVSRSSTLHGLPLVEAKRPCQRVVVSCTTPGTPHAAAVAKPKILLFSWYGARGRDVVKCATS